MKKGIQISVVAAAFPFSIVGCGGGGGGTPANTAYYVDSAVEGVDYICGEFNGTTEADGAFTFDPDKNCTFSLAGAMLETIDKSRLASGKKIVTSEDVAQVLQTIDGDGDPSNGIQIKDICKTNLKQAFADKKNLSFTDLQKEARAIKGSLKDMNEVTKHLTETNNGITKELLAGKTLYDLFMPPFLGAEPELNEVTFDSSLSKMTFGKEIELGDDDQSGSGDDQSGSDGDSTTIPPMKIKVDDGNLKVDYNRDGSYIGSIEVEQEDGYIYFGGDEFLFDSESAAKAYYNKHKKDSNPVGK